MPAICAKTGGRTDSAELAILRKESAETGGIGKGKNGKLLAACADVVSAVREGFYPMPSQQKLPSDGASDSYVRIDSSPG